MLTQLTLPRGEWELEVPYTSSLPVDVTLKGLHTTLPANLDRLGSRWRIRRIAIWKQQRMTVSFHTGKDLLTPVSAATVIPSLVATPLGTERIVPVRRACGQYVDWYSGTDE